MTSGSLEVEDVKIMAYGCLVHQTLFILVAAKKLETR